MNKISLYETLVYVDSNTGFSFIKAGFLDKISPALAIALASHVINIDNTEVVPVDIYLLWVKRLAKDDAGLIDFNFDLMREMLRKVSE